MLIEQNNFQMIKAVNGSPSQSRKITSIVKTSQHASLPTDLGYTVLTSSDMSLTTSPSNTVGLRVQPITGAQSVNFYLICENLY